MSLAGSLRGVVTCVAAGLLSPVAWAAPGEHLVAGDVVVAPRIGLGFEYTSNATRVEEVTASDGATNLRIAPGLDLWVNRPDLAASLKGTYELRKHFVASQVGLDRYDDFTLVGDIDALKESMLGFRIGEAVGLQNFPVDAESLDHPYTKQFRNQTSAAVAFRPRSAIEIAAGGSYSLDDYSTASSGSDQRHYNTRHTYGPVANAAWHVLPRTAVVIDFSYSHAFYTDPVVEQEASEDVVLPDHNMLRIAGGLRGRIIDRLVVGLTAGYGSAAYIEESVPGTDPAAAIDLQGIDRLLLNINARYEISSDDGISASLQKDYRDSFFTNYVSYLKGQVGVDARFTPRIGFIGEFSVADENFRGMETRNDLVLGAKLDLSYYIREWASVSAGGSWQERASDDISIQYDQFSARLLANIQY